MSVILLPHTRAIRDLLKHGLSVLSLCTYVQWINADSPPARSLVLSCGGWGGVGGLQGRSGQIKAALSVRKWIISR